MKRPRTRSGINESPFIMFVRVELMAKKQNEEMSGTAERSTRSFGGGAKIKRRKHTKIKKYRM